MAGPSLTINRHKYVSFRGRMLVLYNIRLFTNSWSHDTGVGLEPGVRSTEDSILRRKLRYVPSFVQLLSTKTLEMVGSVGDLLFDGDS